MQRPSSSSCSKWDSNTRCRHIFRRLSRLNQTYLSTEVSNIGDIFFGDLRAHRDLRCFFHLRFHISWQDIGQIHISSTRTVPYSEWNGRMTSLSQIADELLTNTLYCLAESDIILNEFSQFRKMPSVPFFASHDVIIRFFVEIIQQRYRKTVRAIRHRLNTYRWLEQSLCRLCPERISTCTVIN